MPAPTCAALYSAFFRQILRIFTPFSGVSAFPPDRSHPAAGGRAHVEKPLGTVRARARGGHGKLAARGPGGRAQPVVAIRTKNAVGLTGLNLARAQELTTEIYAEAGVTLRWTTGRDVNGTSNSHYHPDDHRHGATGASLPGSMGVAPSPGDGTRGTTAYIFMDKVRSFCRDESGQQRNTSSPAHWRAKSATFCCRPTRTTTAGSWAITWHPGLFPPRAPGVPDSAGPSTAAQNSGGRPVVGILKDERF